MHPLPIEAQLARAAEKTIPYGHFGKNDPDLTWEQTDKVGALKNALS